MRKQLKPTSTALYLVLPLLGIFVATEALAIDQDQPVNPSASALISGGRTNVPAPLHNSQKLNMAEWFKQQVAMRAASPAAGKSVVVAKGSSRKEAIRKLEQSVGGEVKVSLRKNGTPSQIKGALLARRSSRAQVGKRANSEMTARDFVQDNSALLSIIDSDNEFTLEKTETDDLGRQHLLFSQKHKDLKVWPCEVRIHLDPQGNVDLMEGA